MRHIIINLTLGNVVQIKIAGGNLLNISVTPSSENVVFMMHRHQLLFYSVWV